MRPVNSMIEFKQIIGRGTRLYDGKDFFTLYDFVKAHHHFNDPEWDGEPAEPVPTIPGGKGGEPKGDPKEPPKRPRKIKIKLADGKDRVLQHIAATSFWSADGKPMSAAQFLESLYGTLPDYFHDEDELRTLWSSPETRKALLQGLADKGFGQDQLVEIQKVIDAENSDLFDVLAYIAFALRRYTRQERAEKAQPEIRSHFNDKQQAFLDFVLSQYVKEGVDELDQEKLAPLLKLHYGGVADAKPHLGDPQQIRELFLGFQKYLYTE
jgi:type I restriction enzyme R subunit